MKKNIVIDEKETEETYLSSLQDKYNRCVCADNGDVDIHISLTDSAKIVKVTVIIPLSFDCRSMQLNGMGNDFCGYSVADGKLKATAFVLRQNEGAISDLSEIISALIAKASSMKLALEVIENG